MLYLVIGSARRKQVCVVSSVDANNSNVAVLQTAVLLGALQFLYENSDKKDRFVKEVMNEMLEQYIPRSLFQLHKQDEWGDMLRAG